MIRVKSNINQFLKNYKKRVDVVKLTLSEIAEKLAQKMSADMAMEIHNLRHVWVEDGNLSTVSNIDFDIKKIDDSTVVVSIGDNLKKFEMGDGALVNPVFFIEFGFGIVGQENPKKNHEAYDWEYNINEHKTAWYYYDHLGYKYRTSGREGINFMYRVIQEYKTNWLKYLQELLKENGAYD